MLESEKKKKERERERACINKVKSSLQSICQEVCKFSLAVKKMHDKRKCKKIKTKKVQNYSPYCHTL